MIVVMRPLGDRSGQGNYGLYTDALASLMFPSWGAERKGMYYMSIVIVFFREKCGLMLASLSKDFVTLLIYKRRRET